VHDPIDFSRTQFLSYSNQTLGRYDPECLVSAVHKLHSPECCRMRDTVLKRHSPEMTEAAAPPYGVL
jgi:hypothetical protein